VAETRTTREEVQAEILDAFRKGQEAAVDTIKHWAATIQSIAPSAPVRNLPYADKLPRPEELVASAYDFGKHLLAAQRSFAESVLQAIKPLMSDTKGTTPPKGDSPAK
jgi:hypothetical protein